MWGKVQGFVEAVVSVKQRGFLYQNSSLAAAALAAYRDFFAPEGGSEHVAFLPRGA